MDVDRRVSPDTSAPAGLGWDERWASTFADHAASGLHPGRVIAAHRGAWIVATAHGDRRGVLAGRLRHEATGPGDLPAVGDWAALAAPAPGAPRDTGGSPVVVAALLPRRTVFGRNREDGQTAAGQVLAANVDVALVVAGLDGDFSLRRLERYLAVAWSGGTRPVIVLNKADAAGDPEAARAAAAAIAPGVEVRTISALAGDGVAELARDHLRPGCTGVVLGSSGAGKSTLLNALLGEERARTSPVRGDDARGRHTTTHRQLHRLPGGGLLIDTPGIRALGVAGADLGLAPTFSDVAGLALGCRFADCRHQGEPDCAVLAAVDDGRLPSERLASHRKLEREAAHAARQTDRAAQEAHARKWRAIRSAGRENVARKHGGAR